MDPVSALGAVSSAIGIASFALELGSLLLKLANRMRSARDTLRALGETVQSTAYALEEIEGLLRKEAACKGRGQRLFSATGLVRVKETTDHCLMVLWRIEAVALGEDEPSETVLAVRVRQREEHRSGDGDGEILLDPRLRALGGKEIGKGKEADGGEGESQGDGRGAGLGVWNRLVFAVSAADKLNEYGRQLQNFQISLGLIFDVVMLTHLLGKSSPTDDDKKTIETTNEDLRKPRPGYREVAQVVLHGLRAGGDDGPAEGVPALLLLESPPSPSDKVDRRTKENTGENSSQSPLTAKTRSPHVQLFAVQQPQSEPQHHRRPTVRKEKTARLVNNTRGMDHNLDDEALKVTGTTPDLQEAASTSTSTTTAAAAPQNLMRVYTLQKHEEDWRQERLSLNDVLQRLAKLDLDPMGALDKKLLLAPKYRARVDAIEAQVNREEERVGKAYEWTLRQLELKEKKAWRVLGRSWGLLALVVYLERESMQHLLAQEVVHLPIDMSRRKANGFGPDFHTYSSLSKPMGRRRATLGSQRRSASELEQIRSKVLKPLRRGRLAGFEDSEFRMGLAMDFPIIPGEEHRNTELSGAHIAGLLKNEPDASVASAAIEPRLDDDKSSTSSQAAAAAGPGSVLDDELIEQLALLLTPAQPGMFGTGDKLSVVEG